MATKAASSWWESAACRSADPDLFFPVSVARPARADVIRAKAVCATCVIRRQCLDYALECGPVHGVWGGTSEIERQQLSAGARSVSGQLPA